MKATNSAGSPGDAAERLKVVEIEIKLMSAKVDTLIVKIDSLDGVNNDSNIDCNDVSENLMLLPKSISKSKAATNGRKKKNAEKARKRELNEGSLSLSWDGKKRAWILSSAIFAAVFVTLALGLGGENGRMVHVEPTPRTDKGMSAKSGKGIGTIFSEKEKRSHVDEESEELRGGLERGAGPAVTVGDFGTTETTNRLIKSQHPTVMTLGKTYGMGNSPSIRHNMKHWHSIPNSRKYKIAHRLLEESTSIYYPRVDGYCDKTPNPSLRGHETPEECCNVWYPSEKEECLLQTKMHATTSPVASTSNVPPFSLSPSSVLPRTSPPTSPKENEVIDETSRNSSVSDVPSTSSSSASASPTTTLPTSQVGNGEILDVDNASLNPSTLMTFPPSSSFSTEVSSQLSQQPAFEANVYFGSDPQFCGNAHFDQRDYRGTINMTFSGKACMRWNDTANYTADDYPDAGLDENYCRNPNGTSHAWCFTSEDGYFEYCDVPLCIDCLGYDPQTCGCASTLQREYRGTINTTLSGKACIRWNDFNYTEVDILFAGLNENYCRNPDGDDLVWCYVNEDVGWEYCDVPLCPVCKNSNFERCGCRDLNQADYRGSIHTTVGGKECIDWEDTPYDYDLQTASFKPDRYQEAGLEENYCRNPDSRDGQAWCYFGQGGNDWDYCDVPFCGDECDKADPDSCGCRNSKQQDYRGTTSTTATGKECVRWEDTPHYTPENYPYDSLQENFCRNPGGVYYEAWCIDMEGYHQLCNIPYCGETSTSQLCQDSDTDYCQCANMYEKDYTGTVNVTRSGLPCANWEVIGFFSVAHETLPAGSLNYCRNPDLWDQYGSRYKRDHAWCYTKDRYGGPFNLGWDYCDIPVCGGDNATCMEMDKTTCGCRNVNYADYRGNNSHTAWGDSCENWNKTKIINAGDYPDAGLDGNNFCRNPESSPNPWCSIDFWGDKKNRCYVPSCNPCSCKPPSCDLDSNTEACGCPSALQAEECCIEDNNDECRCEYLKVACRKSIEIGKADFCGEAFDTCCGGSADCMCSVTSSICFDSPGLVCNVAADYCCSSPDAYSYHHCKCDFSNYVDKIYPIEFRDTRHSCSVRDGVGAENVTLTGVDQILKAIYETTTGDFWLNKIGWLDEEVEYCDWYGVSCESRIVIGIDLRGNNLTGPFPYHNISMLHDIQSLDLANNALSGSIDYVTFYNLRHLSHIDLSSNQLSGAVDILISPAAKYVNFSQNNFSSIHRHKIFHPALLDLEIVDLSHNRINQDASLLFQNPPPNIVELYCSDNLIQGSLPEQLSRLESLKVLDIRKNNMTGTLPEFSWAFPDLRVLKLSNQGTGNDVGLVGPIPESLANLGFLRELHLSKNSLSNTIPPELGNLAQLTVLDLSHNKLNQSIPSNLGSIAVLDLSSNNLTGKIPFQLGSLTDSNIRLKGNANLSAPAPLSLCSIENYIDLWEDIHFCPVQRLALADFYESAKGGERTENDDWLDNYLDYCEWRGVTCDERKNVINLILPNFGLSGKLSEKISKLEALETLDLSSNNMKGSIPSEIGSLSKLTYLRLCYNEFTGQLPSQLGDLQHIELLQLHDNRFKGIVPSIKLEKTRFNESSFIADCGVPSVFDAPLICLDCTMCCNSKSECYPTEETNIQKSNFSSYKEFTWVFFLSDTGIVIMIFLVSFMADKYNHRSEPIQSSIQRSESMKRRAKKYAFDKMGERSVYSFFLGKNWCGWMIALAVLGVQLWVLFVFVIGAEQDLSDDKSDFVFTWKCFRDEEKCSNEADLDATGWIIFGILMTSHLLPDIINGAKMVVLGGKECYDFNQRARFFFGGLLLVTVTAFTLFTSVVYNRAIATSNTEIVTNAVVILFITDLDEQCFRLIKCIDEGMITLFGGRDDNQEMPKLGITTMTAFEAVPSTATQTGSITPQGLVTLKIDDIAQMKHQIEKKLEIFWEEVNKIQENYLPPNEASDEDVKHAFGNDVDKVEVAV